MKKYLTFLAVAALAVSASAQTQADLEAKKADIENQLTNYDDGIAKKWEFKLDGAFSSTLKGNDDIAVTSGDDNGMFNAGIGYNFNSNVFFGVNSGYYPSVGSAGGGRANNFIPVLADFVYRWNVGEKQKWSIFAEARAGYLFSVADDKKLADGTNYEFPNGCYFEIQPGIYYRLKRNIDIKFSIGYGYLMPADDTPDLAHNENLFVAKLGVNFRSAPKTPERSVLLADLAAVNGELEALRIAAEEAARQEAARLAAEEAARKAAAEAAARKVAEEEAARLAALEAAKHQSLTLFYEIRESDLTTDQNEKLQQLAEWAKTRQIDKIVVKGYADKGTGNPTINKVYAKNRAEKVKKALIKKYGIDKNLIEATSFGDTEQPFNENDQNRCAVILVNQID